MVGKREYHVTRGGSCNGTCLVNCPTRLGLYSGKAINLGFRIAISNENASNENESDRMLRNRTAII